MAVAWLPITLAVMVDAAFYLEEARLHKQILHDYNRNVLPIDDEPDSLVEVSVCLHLLAVLRLDEKREILTTSSWVGISWKDGFLTWNESDFGGLGVTHLAASLVWLPDIVVANSVEEFGHLSDSSHLVRIASGGRMDWHPADVLRTSCKVDITNYPFDMQTCTIRFLARKYTLDKVNVTVDTDAVSLESYEQNDEWEMMATSSWRFEVPEGNLSGAMFTLTLRRRTAFHIMNTIFPIILLSYLNNMVFVLPCGSSEKMAISATLLLSYAVFFNFVTDTMPKTSESVSLFALLVEVYLLLCSLSILLTTSILYVHYMSWPTTPPSWLKKMARALDVSLPRDKDPALLFESLTRFEGKSREEITWKMVADALDNLLFKLASGLSIGITSVMLIVMAIF